MDAQQAAERAAERIAPSFKAFYTQRDVDIAAVDILAEFAPLLAAKDADAAALREIAKKCGYVGHEGRGPAVTIVRHIDRLAAEVAELRRVKIVHEHFQGTIRNWWRFDGQEPCASWHDREDYIKRWDAAVAAQKV